MMASPNANEPPPPPGCCSAQDCQGESFSTGSLSQGVEASRGAYVESFTAMDEEALRNNLDLDSAPTVIKQFISSFESAATDGSMNLVEFRGFLTGFIREKVFNDLFGFVVSEGLLQELARSPISPFEPSVVETMSFPTQEEMIALMTDHLELLIPILTNGFFKVWDRDHDGSLTIKELLVTINMIKEVPGDELGPFIVGKFFFEVADSDSNGRLDCSEMADFLSEILSVPFSLVRPILEVVKAVVKGPAMSEASKGFMESLKVLDTNHDGLLSAEEAVALFAKEPEQTAMADAQLSETLAAAEPALAQARAELHRVLALKFELSQRESAPVAEVANALVGAAAGHATQQLDEVRPLLDGMLQEMATAFPFPTQRVLPVFHGLVQQAYGLVRSTACRRFVVAFCNILDKNGDGLVRAADLRAMLELLAPAGEGGVVARTAALFKIFDANDNGQLSKEELELMVGKLLDIFLEYFALVVEIVKRLLLGNLEPLLQLAAGMVGDGTSFSYEELLNLQNTDMGPMRAAMPFM